MFGIPIPPEPPRISALAPLPDVFEGRIRALLADMKAHGADSFAREAERTAARQEWLWGFGRLYNDGRGRVTNAKSPLWSWHFYLLAVDIVEVQREDNAPGSYWRLLQSLAHANGLTSGLDWTTLSDAPHVQFGGMKQSPSNYARWLYATGGKSAVWRAVGAGDNAVIHSAA
jgi:hypothetical protein